MKYKKTYKVAVADNELSFAQGLSGFIQSAEIQVVSIMNDYDKLLDDVSNCDVDLLILDINFGGGRSSLDLLEKMKEKNSFKVCILTSYNTRYLEAVARKKGADNFLDKYLDLESIKEKILSFLKFGITYFRNHKGELIKITPRELELIKLLYRGFIEKEIADKMTIANSTVKTHKKNLFEKFNVQNQTELISTCIKLGILLV